MQQCPFCGAPETDRIDLEGSRYLVFRCMFTPRVDPGLDESALGQHLSSAFNGPSGEYFRGVCDRLHLHVTKGEGARVLTAPGPAPPNRL
ncbi:MAG: hypothetical protein L3K19_07350 [Thermoplasmata archaeon]|nr:hypothetical protein [Thermoplasmata archaeon]